MNITVRTNPGAYAPPREGRRRVPRGLLATGREAIIFCCIFALPSLIVVYEEPPMKCTGRMRMTLPRTAKVFGVAPTAATKDAVRRRARSHSRFAPPPVHVTTDPLREGSVPLYLKRRCASCDRRPLGARRVLRVAPAARLRAAALAAAERARVEWSDVQWSCYGSETECTLELRRLGRHVC